MINRITGEVSGRAPGTVLLSTGSLELALDCSDWTAGRIRLGDVVTLFSWLYVREDQLRLFAFATEAERRLFLQLIGVTGIGAKQALKMLGAGGPDQLGALIAAADTQGLSRIPGIGARTAAKIVLALQGELVMDEPAESGPARLDELVAGLVDMGFDAREAGPVVARLRSEYEHSNEAGVPVTATTPEPAADIEARIFREAIQRLSRNP